MEERPFLNRRTEALVGRVFTLDKPILDGVGSVRIDDTVWRVSGADRPAGSHSLSAVLFRSANHTSRRPATERLHLVFGHNGLLKARRMPAG